MAVAEKLIAKYPFLTQGRELLAETEKVDLLEIENAVSDTASWIRQPNEYAGRDARNEVRKLALNRLLLTALNNPVAFRKFALNYGRTLRKRLQDEEPGVLLEVAKDFLPTIVESSGNYAVSFIDFVRKGGELKDVDLSAGIVYLTRAELAALVAKAVESKLSSPAGAAKIPPEFKEAAEELRAAIPTVAVKSSFKGKYLQLPCVQNILAGQPEGKRFYGAMTLAIACLKDGLSKEQAEAVMQDYVNVNPRGTHEYSLREALATLDWVFKRGSIGFACSVTQSNGLGGDFCNDCVFNRKRRVK